MQGKSNKEIGTELDISEATVKTHINSLLSKLGVTDRTQAATAAIRRGIVPLRIAAKAAIIIRNLMKIACCVLSGAGAARLPAQENAMAAGDGH